MKKLLIVLCAFFMMAACAPKETEVTNPEDNGAALGGVTIANPFVDYDSLEEACEAANETIYLMDGFAGREVSEFRAMPGKMLEVIYGEVGDMIKVRKTSGVEDNSGNYSADVFEESTMEYHGITLNIQSKDDLVRVAYWSLDNKSYSMTSDAGIETADLLSLVDIIHFTKN